MVLFVCGIEMCFVDCFVYVFVIVSLFCWNIFWVEVDLVIWVIEKKIILYFLFSFMYCFGVNFGCDIYFNYCSYVVVNVLLKMGLVKWLYSCYRKFNIKFFDFMLKELRELVFYIIWLVLILFLLYWYFSCF